MFLTFEIIIEEHRSVTQMIRLPDNDDSESSEQKTHEEFLFISGNSAA